MDVSCLLLAAGDSSRMGGENKLMLKIDNQTLVKRTFEEIKKIPFKEVIVVTGHEDERIRHEISSEYAFNEDHQSGMHSSIKTGLRAFKAPCTAAFVCLSDQPYFDHRNLLALIEHASPDRIIVPVFDGKRGHPVLIGSTFFEEILNEPDGDYGCAYLLKRHPEKVMPIPMDSHGILVDIDEPKDYQRFLKSSYDAKDPVEEFYKKTNELRLEGKPFVIATIIEVIGSASARTGSKALIDLEGKNLLGWVGGGCAERFIGEESVKAIQEGKTRIILADLDDEIFGLGVACGGKMRVFLDPIIPAETVFLPESSKFQNEIRLLSSFYGWNVRKDFSLPEPESIEDLFLIMTETLAKKRGRSGESLREVKNVPATFLPTENLLRKKEVTIVGRTRITEALARHFALLAYSIRAIGPDLKAEDYPSNIQCHCLNEGYGEINFRPGEVVIIASHTSQDPRLVEKALKQEASHVAMIGSYKRSLEVLNHLNLEGKEISHPLYVPAGLDMDAKNPDEIALSVVSEIILKTKRAL